MFGIWELELNELCGLKLMYISQDLYFEEWMALKRAVWFIKTDFLLKQRLALATRLAAWRTAACCFSWNSLTALQHSSGSSMVAS